MYENNTEETIKQRMMENISSEVDKSEGSFVNDAIAPVSSELAQTYLELDNIIKLAFPQTSSGEYLDLICESHGVIRKLGQNATGQVTFSGADNSVISAGTIVQTDGGLQYTTNTDAIISSGNATVNIEAVDKGSTYNVPAGAITILPVVINGVTSVTNVSSITGGADDETDDELLSRLLQKVSNPPSSGNKGDYERWAKEITGVSYVKVLPLVDGPGTVKLVIAGENGQPLDSTIIQAVKNHIDPSDGTGEGVAPLGATVSVVTVTTITIDISITGLIAKDGYTLEAVKTNIENSINSYIDSLHPGDTVQYNKILSTIINTTGVMDFTGIQVNSSNANIVTTDEEKAILGTITYI